MPQTLARFLRFITLITLAFTVTACCDQHPQEKSKITATTVTPITTPAAVPATAPYPATLAEGIDFAKPGYPAFIAETSGMSGYEPWGRWTDGEKAIFRLTQLLPKQFTLVIQANAFGPNLGEAVKVKIGAAQQEFKVSEQYQTYRLDFTLPEPVDTIEFLIPKPSSPRELKVGDDPRKLGIGLIKLQIQDKGL